VTEVRQVTSSRPDVAIVGAGIAGGALSTVLARAGLDVLLLERQVEYRDRVRGEVMYGWGVAELLRMGLGDVLLDAGGGYATSLVLCDELLAARDIEPMAIPLDGMTPGVPGSMNVGHPQACEALAQAAARAGARLERGVTDVTVTPGSPPSLGFRRDGTTEEVRPRLVVGADGRASSVRKACGLELQETAPRVMLAGFLVSDASAWPATANCTTTEGDYFVLGFPRPGGFVRLYAAYDVHRKDRFTGPDKVDAFIGVLSSLTSIPYAGALARSQPAGPLGAYPMTDSWMDEPLVPGVVLTGDAAGWSDPTIGQGLSVAMRDVRILGDILGGGAPWDFRPYAEERRERMRRLRIALEVMVATRCDFTDRGRARRAAFNEQLFTDPLLLAVALIPITGPDAAPDKAVTDETLETVRALGA
jgi:2-polyprenyl-6-methoxyphenol hydroxylase-like FAD-dependent oxidoreductase